MRNCTNTCTPLTLSLTHMNDLKTNAVARILCACALSKEA